MHCSPWMLLAILTAAAAAAATMTEGHTKTDCGVAQTAFGMCVPYMMGEEEEVSSGCCMAVRSVKELSPTTRARQGICDCLRTLMAQVGRIDGRRAAGLPAKCRVRTNVIPTSLDYRCFGIA